MAESLVRRTGGSRTVLESAHGRPHAQDRECPVRPDARWRAPDHPRRLDPGGGRPDQPRRQGGRARRAPRRPRDRRQAPARHAGLRQRPHAHQLRARRARDLPRRAGEPARPRLRPAGRHDRGRGIPHDAARPRRAAEERHGVLRGSGQHEVPRRVSPGLRGLRHPRDAGRVRHRWGGPVQAAASTPPARPSPGRRRSSRNGTGGSTAACAPGRCRSRGHLQRRAPAGAASAWRTSAARR